jgi:hypothetical protein
MITCALEHLLTNMFYLLFTAGYVYSSIGPVYEVNHTYLRGRMIAHRFEDQWYIGTYKYVSTAKGRQGLFAVHYADDRTVYLHKLNLDEMGPEGNWVIVKKSKIVKKSIHEDNVLIDEEEETSDED